ncbi:FtsX-like permease family protein [Kribbella sp. NPDC051586]|uniref:FtsX-like permease family protein n=1 Tax=Kribbella sp. NPDC051586 TaxID=3364118 RepID=UPI0037A482C6
MRRWSVALRLARRSARRSRGRTLLIAALIGLPVLVGSWFAVVDKGLNPTGEAFANAELGSADALVSVSSYSKFPPMTEEPSLSMVGQTVPDGRGGAERSPSSVDVHSLFPAGTQIARTLAIAGGLEIKAEGTNASVTLMVGDGASPLTQGTFRLDAGRMPTAAQEVAVSPALAEHLGVSDGHKLTPGARLTTATGTTYSIVGLARTLDAPQWRTVFAPPASPLTTADQPESIAYLVSLPGGVDAKTLVDPLNARGITLVPRANVVDPPPSVKGDSALAGTSAATALGAGFGVLEIVLLAGTAFAVGARRQTRDLGLLTSMGATAADIRRVVLAQGLFAAAVGVFGGLALGVAVALAGRSWWESAAARLINQWQVPWLPLLGVVLIGLLAGLAAALAPALSAGRQTPLAALAGRFATVVGTARLRRSALVLVAGGVVVSVLGNVRLASALAAARSARDQADPQQLSRVASVTPFLPIALVFLGITLVIAGLIWALPALIGKAAALAYRLPLSSRMALRDAARHRHRTGPATAAIMLAVAGTVALTFAVVNQSAAAAKNYVPAGHDGDAVLPFDTADVEYSPQLVNKLEHLLPVERTFELQGVSARNVKTEDGSPVGLSVVPPAGPSTSAGLALLAVDPAYVERFGAYGNRAAAALRAGKVVVPQADLSKDGRVRIGRDDDYDYRKTFFRPAAVVMSPPNVGRLARATLVSTETAASIGALEVDEVHFQLRREPTAAELGAVAKLLGHEDTLTVEHGYQSPVRKASAGLLVLGTVAALLGVSISVSLSLAEGRADLATLAAVGASPRSRKRLAGSQAWVLGQVGCVLGLGAGALYGYTAHAAFGSPKLVVPWSVLAGIGLVVPLFASAIAWALTRSRMPMVRRAE